MKNKITTVIFDWGEVIALHTYREIVEASAKILNTQTDKLLPILQEHWEEFHEGTIEEKEFWKKIGGIMKVDVPNIDSIWGDSIKSVYRSDDRMIDLLKNLRKNGYKVGLLSNAEMCVVDLFEKMKDFNALFDASVFSCVVKVSKPKPAIYEIILKKLNSKAEESVFVDDRLENVAGADNLGIYGIHYKGYDYLIEKLENLDVVYK